MSAPSSRDDAARPEARADAPASARSTASRALEEIAALIDAGDLCAARKGLTAARARLDPAEAERADALHRRLSTRERLAGPTAAFEAARARRDWVSARESARRAAEAAEGEEAAAWLVAVEDCAKRVRVQWCIEQHVLPGAERGEPTADVVASLWSAESIPSRTLADGGATLVLVSVHGRWVFLREIDVSDRLPRRIGWLRAPEALGFRPPVEVEGDAIRLVGSGGQVLHLSRDPLDVVRWTSLRPFMLPDRGVESALSLPGGRILWAQLKDPSEERGVVAIDLNEWRVCGRPGNAWSFAAVPGSKPPRVLAQSGAHSELCDERGARIDWRPPSCGQVEALVAHPSGAGFLALCAVWGPEGEDPEAPFGLVEMLPGRPPSAPLVLPGTRYEARAALAVSLEKRLAFLLAWVEGEMRLSAFRVGPNGLERLWSTRVPPETSLAQDCEALRVVAAVATERGLDIAPLCDVPPEIEGADEGPLLADSEPPFSLCNPSGFESAQMELADAIWRCRRDGGDMAQLAEKHRRERRRDPAALAQLAQQLANSREVDLAAAIAAFGLSRSPGHALLVLVQAEVAALRGRWDETARILDGLAPADLPVPRACHLHHLRGLAHLRAGEVPEAQRQFSAGARLDERLCSVRWNLAVCGGLADPVDARALGPGVSRGEGSVGALVRACRRSDAARERGDAAAARDLLDVPAAHRWVELQSAARLAEAHLALEPTSPAQVFRKAVAVARLHEVAAQKPFGLRHSIPGLGWSRERAIEVAGRGARWLEETARARAAGEGPPEPAAASSASASSAPSGAPPPRGAPAGESSAVQCHSLPPVGHEAVRELAPGLDEAIRETVRYVRGQPGWDETQTLCEDVSRLGPMRAFLGGRFERFLDWGMDEQEALEENRRLSEHLDHCVNFELHRRKLFFVDASLAWMLAQTNLDIEGRALRLPFPSFGQVYTDRATLETAEALLSVAREELAGRRLQVLTVYVKRLPAPEGRSELSLSMVFDPREGHWPALLRRELSFEDSESLEDILAGRPAGARPGAARENRPAPRGEAPGPSGAQRGPLLDVRRRRVAAKPSSGQARELDGRWAGEEEKGARGSPSE